MAADALRVLVTGASGFVGNALTSRLLANPLVEVTAAYRRNLPTIESRAKWVPVGDLLPDTSWENALHGVQYVIHLAARVHVMNDKSLDPLLEFRKVNVDATRRLAEQAVAAGVRRFVYVSSIKVNGESTEGARAFRPTDRPQPSDPYGVSKLEAELALQELASATGMELVIIRPPLVYGPGVRANFRNMMVWLKSGVPLPLGRIDNRRSLVGLDNLCDLIETCMRHPAAAGQTFLASDGEDVSTSDLLRRLGLALGRPARLVPIPRATLQFGLRLLGKSSVALRLCDSLQVDISPNAQRLDWRPPYGLDHGLRVTADAFLSVRVA